jgi:hypothetical protein
MLHVEALNRAVLDTLASKRLGTPVFVRYLFQTQDKPGAVSRRLAQTVAAIRGWVNQPLERIYALGQVKNRQWTLTVEFRGGATAVVGWSAGTAPDDGVDLMVLGNHGALYHDFGDRAQWHEGAAAGAAKPDASLVTLIERALRSGRVEPAGR